MFVMLCQGWWYNHSSKALAAAAFLILRILKIIPEIQCALIPLLRGRSWSILKHFGSRIQDVQIATGPLHQAVESLVPALLIGAPYLDIAQSGSV